MATLQSALGERQRNSRPAISWRVLVCGTIVLCTIGANADPHGQAAAAFVDFARERLEHGATVALIEEANALGTNARAKPLARNLAAMFAGTHERYNANTMYGAEGTGYDPVEGLADPSPQCKRTLNRWAGACVFGGS